MRNAIVMYYKQNKRIQCKTLKKKFQNVDKKISLFLNISSTCGYCTVP